MVTLIQVIIYINSLNVPQITLINHYNSNELCNKSLNAVYTRLKKGNINVSIIKDDEDYDFLKVVMKEKSTKSYWFCKKAIFYKNNSLK